MVSEPDTGQCANKDIGPLRGVDWGVLHRLERGTSASKDAGTRRRVDCEIPLVGEDNKAFFGRVWKPLPSKHVLKTLRGSSKGKAQRGQYPLEGCGNLSLANTF